MSQTGRLAGKVALITGASNGIGHAITQLFAAQGARIAAISRHAESLEQWRNTPTVLPIQADVTQPEDIHRMFERTEGEWGPVDVVCNVAGINDLCYPLEETTDERWDSVLSLDLTAPFRICRRAITGMVKRGGGAILNVGSYAAVRGNHGPSYTAAKAGLTGLSLSIAVAYARHGIRCNVLNPGAVFTQIGPHSGGAYHPGGYQMLEDIVRKFPVRWACEPHEIAPTALFLCSDEASHVNGAVIAVDGGMSAC